MAPFKVIIVGGSVAGLALANMLERYEIDFVVLEKHENIAPDLGACLGLLPNGLRIMDQLGCYEKILECSVPLNLLNSYDENGDAINKMSEVGVWMESLFGYKSLNQDRQQVIDVLFNNIRDKTKVHTSRGLEKIHPLPNGVKVKTADGSVYEGDIVVGADGVHSRVLDEMQRLAEIDTPNSKKFTRDNFECTYRALVCIGPRPKGIREDEGIKNCRKGRSHLCLSGQNGKWYFNIFEKTEHKTRGSSIPRYTKSDAHAMASAYANDILIPGVTFGDLYKNRTSSMLLPVEEGVLPRCFYNRIILVGDSYHKSTPLFGQGGNNCIVSAAYLANKLHSIKSYDSKPDDELIQNIFQNFQDTRHPETSLIATLGNRIQRLDAFENPVMKFINMKVLPELSSHYIWHAMAQAHTSTWLLDYLPFPSPSHGMLPSRNEIWLKPQVRCGKTNKVWMGLLILPLLAFSAIFWERNNQSPLSSVDTASRLDNEKAENLYFHLLDTAVTGFIAIESNRATYSMKLIGSSLPFGIASLVLGWHIVAPLYFCQLLLATGSKTFYYPSVRLIDPTALILLGPAYAITYFPALLCSFTSKSFPSSIWDRAHVSLPLTIYLLKQSPSSSMPRKLSMDCFLKDRHIKPLFVALGILCIPQIVIRYFMTNMVSRLIDIFQSERISDISSTSLRITSLELIILTFLLFAYFDLRRVNAVSRSTTLDVLLAISVSLLLGPTIALLIFWGIREIDWKNAYQGAPMKKTV